ncbi:MAG TPA: zinc-binding dehydrogenase [Lacunisphaera sp.]|jgi:propanol-preferring alcohol dehydrogenase|nr:zinc-binding dehydrogenase [Lacunisphaera sp.]
MHDVSVPEPGPDDALIRVRAAGICHSDAHYRAGTSSAGPLPLALGHEVAGVVERVGPNVRHFHPGDRVCVHYLATCGTCAWCTGGHEQFCATGQMLGKHRPGGFAEFTVMPARSLFALPPEISFAHGAVLMCSSATALHALRKARLQPGESVAVFGLGGLGASAVQLARALGARDVYAVDLNPAKLALAERFGARPVDARATDPVPEILRLTGGAGVQVALELIGLPQTMQQAVRVLGKMGRAALAGLTPQSFAVQPYTELINQEAEIIGVSDHLAREIPELLRLARSGALDLGPVVTRTVPLGADAINGVLDELARFGGATRTVVEVAG